MILSQAQVESVYSVICALNNVGNVSSEFNLPNDIWVASTSSGGVMVVPRVYGAAIEQYSNQAAFAEAYGLI